MAGAREIGVFGMLWDSYTLGYRHSGPVRIGDLNITRAQLQTSDQDGKPVSFPGVHEFDVVNGNGRNRGHVFDTDTEADAWYRLTVACYLGERGDTEAVFSHEGTTIRIVRAYCKRYETFGAVSGYFDIPTLYVTLYRHFGSGECDFQATDQDIAKRAFARMVAALIAGEPLTAIPTEVPA